VEISAAASGKLPPLLIATVNRKLFEKFKS